MFDHSWALLGPREQEAMRKLAVFRGGFRRERSARRWRVRRCRCWPRLVDKSLLRLSPSGRFDRHPLLYQYTRERFSEHPEEQAQAEERHGPAVLSPCHSRY